MQFDAFGRGSGDGERQERLMPVFLGADTGIPGCLDRLRRGPDLCQVLLRQRREDTHFCPLALRTACSRASDTASRQSIIAPTAPKAASDISGLAWQPTIDCLL